MVNTNNTLAFKSKIVLLFIGLIMSIFGSAFSLTPSITVQRTSKRKTMWFYRLPIDNLQGVQWFGRTERAYELKANNDSNVYQYCQWQHCGLDLLAPFGTPVYAGVIGTVIRVDSIENGRKSDYEGPYKIMIQVGDYVVEYGHTDGTAFVKEGDVVTPDTLITGVGNQQGRPYPVVVDHIHLEIRKGSWTGWSMNPTQYMSDYQLEKLIEVATNQKIEVEMGRFFDGRFVYIYTSNPHLNPPFLARYEVPFN